ncbi:MAG: ATP cone domain-containing protein, partial [Candidatus Pacebacteria bacterium]|nr:ATP cone domain-containing protein [Candidatus Paceibacterota bacterium]
MTSKKKPSAAKSVVKNIQKRDGTIVPFNKEKIMTAVEKAMNAAGEGDRAGAEKVAGDVMKEIAKITSKYRNFIPAVEGVQDIVEKQLILNEYAKTAKHYILYREERARIRSKGFQIPENVKKLAEDSKKYFRNPLGEFVYYRTYSKWIDDEGRRETWIETVNRYVAFMKENLGDKLTDKEYAEVREGILKQEAMPSMRLLQFAGKAAASTNVCAYNCSFTAPEKFQDLAEIMYIS